MAFPELGGNGAASGSTGRRVARQWAAARRHSDARFGKSPGILHRGPRHHGGGRSEEHTSELQSLMRISYAVVCLKKKNNRPVTHIISNRTTVKRIYTNTEHIIL